MLLILDNYDSFTYNLVQYLEELGAETRTFRNDELTVDEAVELAPERVVISPGPATPEQAGISLALVERLSGSLPILPAMTRYMAMLPSRGDGPAPFGLRPSHSRELRCWLAPSGVPSISFFAYLEAYPWASWGRGVAVTGCGYML